MNQTVIEKKRNLEEVLEMLPVITSAKGDKKRKIAELAIKLGRETQGTLLSIDYLEEQTSNPCTAVGYLDDYNPGDLNVFLDQAKRNDISFEKFRERPSYSEYIMIRIYQITDYRKLEQAKPDN